MNDGFFPSNIGDLAQGHTMSQAQGEGMSSDSPSLRKLPGLYPGGIDADLRVEGREPSFTCTWKRSEELLVEMQ